MATDIREIQLTDEQKRRIAEIAERSGQSWSDILNEQLTLTDESAATEAYWTFRDTYIRDPQKRAEYFREWAAKRTSRNPDFDDSRECIYPDRR